MLHRLWKRPAAGKLKKQVQRAQELEENQKEDLEKRKKELDEKEEEVEGFKKKQVRRHAYVQILTSCCMSF